jgi:hypothetical protein
MPKHGDALSARGDHLSPILRNTIDLAHFDKALCVWRMFPQVQAPLAPGSYAMESENNRKACTQDRRQHQTDFRLQSA